MNLADDILAITLMTYGIIVIGYIVRRVGWLTEEADRTIMLLIINLLMPCLIFDKIVGNERLLEMGNIIVPPIVGAGSLLLGFLIAGLLAWYRPRWTNTPTEPMKRTYAYGVGLYNYGYIPLPMAMLLFNSDTVGVLFVHNLGIELVIWTVGVLLIGAPSGPIWKRILNAPILAIVISLAINFTGVSDHTPGFISLSLGTIIEWLGACSIPLSLLLIGALVADFLPRTKWRHDTCMVISACLLRNALLPLLFLTVAWYFRDIFSPELICVMVIQAAMPAATFTIVMAKNYGGDPPTAMKVMFGSALLSLITLPAWLVLGISWFDLLPT